MKDILVLSCVPVVDYRGNISEQLRKYLLDEDFQRRVVAKLDFRKFDRFYHDFVDIYTVDERRITDYNIKIIYSKDFGNKAKFLYYYKENQDNKWIECNEESALCYDEKYTNFTKTTIEDLVRKLYEDMALGARDTNVYYLGEKKLFNEIGSAIARKFNNIELIYMGDGIHEK